jgi:hypothetical protein
MAAAVLLTGCGEQEPTYSLKATAQCFRAKGYEVDTQPRDEPQARRRWFTVAKGRSLVATMYFHDSPSVAKDRMREIESLRFQGDRHPERHGNVFVLLGVPHGPSLTRADLAVLDSCLS